MVASPEQLAFYYDSLGRAGQGAAQASPTPGGMGADAAAYGGAYATTASDFFDYGAWCWQW